VQRLSKKLSPTLYFNIKANKCPYRKQILITYLAGANMRNKKNGYNPLEKNGDCPLLFMKRGGKNSKRKRIGKGLSPYSLHFINL